MKRRGDEPTSEKVLDYKEGVAGLKRQEDQGRAGSGSAWMIALGLVILMAAVVFVLPSFRVQKIEVAGTSRLDPAVLAAESGVKTGTHLLSGWNGDFAQVMGLRYGDSERLIRESSPYIKDVRVRMDFPGGVLIDIEERTGVSYLQLPDGAWLVLDASGIVLEINEDAAPEGIPMLAGITVEKAEAGKKISSVSIDAIDRSLTSLDAVIRSDQGARDGFSLLQEVESIRSPGSNLVYMKLRADEGEGTVQVKLGDKDTLDDAMNWLRYTVRTGKLDGLGSGVLDLAGEQYVFIRDTEG